MYVCVCVLWFLLCNNDYIYIYIYIYVCVYEASSIMTMQRSHRVSNRKPIDVYFVLNLQRKDNLKVKKKKPRKKNQFWFSKKYDVHFLKN